MKLKEPNLEGWNRYDPKEIPAEKRRLILRTLSDYGIPTYYLITILNKQTGYCFTEIGSSFWNRWEGKGTHWAWLDELVLAKGNQQQKEKSENVHID